MRIESFKSVPLSLNLRVPNRSGIFPDPVLDLDPIILPQFLPLCSIRVDSNPAAIIEHSNFYKRLFVL